MIPLRFGQNNFGHSTKVKNVEIDLFSQSTSTRSKCSS